jgi:glycosyltransferase involved in cell wall biosynthesis
MKISLTIPVFNEERYLRHCLNSVFAQTELPDEVIIVNNNSTDRTVEIAREFPVKIVNESEQGITYARNKGFNTARYEIIARCDADTRLPANWISRIKYDFENYKIDAVGGPVHFYHLPFGARFFVDMYARFVRLVVGEETLIGSNLALTKKMWEEIKDHTCRDEKNIHEDVDLGIHIGQSGGRLLWDRKLVVGVSARRIIKKPGSFFIGYPTKLYNTFSRHLPR